MDPEAYEYVFAIEQARELLPHLDALADVNFVGHSHLCKAFALNAAGDVTEVVAAAVRAAARLQVRRLGRLGRASRATATTAPASCVYDTEERVVEYHRVAYDIEASAQKIFDADLALNFGKRLFLGV